ncbi:MAG TPA: DUF5995 family protein [Longimicrobiaceae bacterium]
MPQTLSPATTTIDEVIARLDDVAASAVRDNSRLAYFACLYRGVTRRVRDGIAAGRFEDGPRMERLDVIFAGRYLAALEAYRRGGRAPRSWTAAFDGTRARHLLIVQHLVLGINAHINFDLGIAAAQTSPGYELRGLKRDFDEISALLGEMLDDVQDRIARVSPWMGVLDRIGSRTDEEICTFCLGGSRDAAWRAAERFAVLGKDALPAELDHLDRVVAALAHPIRSPGPLVQAGLLLARAREPGDVARVVEVFE